MNIQTNAVLTEGLDRYFASFESTLSLVSELQRRRAHATEALILLCARIDALASDAAIEGASNRQAFVRFLAAYSQRRDLFQSVSVADLYWEIGYHRWRLEGTIKRPGKLHRYSIVDDPILHLFEDSGLPLTLTDCGRLLDTLTSALQRRFHVRPRQPRSKAQLADVMQLKQEIVDIVRTTRLRAIAPNLPKALGPLIESKRVASLLYHRFRCEAIHGATVRINQDNFFSRDDVYWEPLRSEYYGDFELVAFPSTFLSDCLRACIRSFRTHLLHKGKIPPDIHFHAFEDLWSNVNLIDDTLLPESGEVRLKIGK